MTTYTVKIRDMKNNTSVMGEHEDEDEAREHEEQLTTAYPMLYVWIES